MRRSWIAIGILAGLTVMALADEPPAGPPDQTVQTLTDHSQTSSGQTERRPESDDRPIARQRSHSVGASAGSEAAATSNWLRPMLSLAGVTALILLLAWGYRAVTGVSPLAARPRAPGMIQVLSRTSLSPKQALVLVRVGPRMVLIGAGADSLTTLHTIDDSELVARLAGEATGSAKAGVTAEFRRTLELAAGDFDDKSSDESARHSPVLSIQTASSSSSAPRANPARV